MDEVTTEQDGIVARYTETPAERLLSFEYEDKTATVAQNRDGYAMVMVRAGPDAPELERYYGLDMALDHAAELLGVPPTALPIPAPARDMGI